MPASKAKLQYPLHASSTRNEVTVKVIWLSNAREVDTVCAKVLNEKANGVIVACYDPSIEVIYAVQPTSFNDKRRLQILGHEFWHALGADHP